MASLATRQETATMGGLVMDRRGIGGNTSPELIERLTSQLCVVYDTILVARNDAKDIMDEARALGLTPKLLRRLAKLRHENAVDRERREAENAEFALYCAAIGLVE